MTGIPMNPQVQEALSKRYGSHTAIVVPLEDGSFAVFAEDRTSESMMIVNDYEELAIAINSRAGMRERKAPSKNRDIGLNMQSLLDGEPLE